MAYVSFNGRHMEGLDDISFADAEVYAHVLALEHAERIYPITFEDRVLIVVFAMSVHYEFLTSNGTRVVYAAVV